MGNNTIRHDIYRGDIFFGEPIFLDGVTTGGKERPYLIISSWKNNIKSPLVNVLPLTSEGKDKEKNVIKLKCNNGKTSFILCAHILTI